MMDIIQQYRDYVCGRLPKYNTRKAYTVHPRLMLQYIQKPLEQITQTDIDRYIQYCYTNRKHNGNALRFWSIRQFLDWAGRDDLIIPIVTPKDAGKQALNEEETDKLLSTIEELSPLHRLVFYLEYDTIRRPDEIRKLKISDRYGYLLRYDGKTGVKQCVMTERLMTAWDDYLQNRPIPQSEEDGKYLILGNWGHFKGKRLKTVYPISRAIKEVAMYSQINVPQGETPTNYLIKRTTISRQLKDCSDPKIIQLQAGHTKLDTTMKYNRITEKDVKLYLEMFEDKRKKIKGKTQITKDKIHLS